MSRPLLLVFEAHSTAERALNKAIYPFLLRRSKPLRELALSSGERASRRSCALRYSSFSCEIMFVGAEHADASCPPANEGSSEVRIPISRLIRRSKPLRELALSSGERPSRRSCALRYSSSSCEGMFAGAEHADAGCPPTNEGSSEVRIPPFRACSGEANLNGS